jgi:hypothetical protein
MESDLSEGAPVCFNYIAIKYEIDSSIFMYLNYEIKSSEFIKGIINSVAKT